MNESAVEEQSARAMIEQVIAEVQLEFSKKSPDEKAFIIIKGFFDAVNRIREEGDVMSDHLSDEFFDWFHHPQNYAAKMRALDRIMEMDDELWGKYGIVSKKSTQPSEVKQDMPDIGRQNRLLGNNQNRI